VRESPCGGPRGPHRRCAGRRAFYSVAPGSSLAGTSRCRRRGVRRGSGPVRQIRAGCSRSPPCGGLHALLARSLQLAGSTAFSETLRPRSSRATCSLAASIRHSRIGTFRRQRTGDESCPLDVSSAVARSRRRLRRSRPRALTGSLRGSCSLACGARLGVLSRTRAKRVHLAMPTIGRARGRRRRHVRTHRAVGLPRAPCDVHLREHLAMPAQAPAIARSFRHERPRCCACSTSAYRHRGAWPRRLRCGRPARAFEPLIQTSEPPVPVSFRFPSPPALEVSMLRLAVLSNR
jgi:hypothetical protein